MYIMSSNILQLHWVWKYAAFADVKEVATPSEVVWSSVVCLFSWPPQSRTRRGETKWPLITNSSQTLNESSFCGSLRRRVCAASSSNPRQKTEAYVFPPHSSSSSSSRDGIVWKQWGGENLRGRRSDPPPDSHAGCFPSVSPFFTCPRYKYSRNRFSSSRFSHGSRIFTLCSRPKKSPTHTNANPAAGQRGWLTCCQLIKALEKRVPPLPFSFTEIRKAAGGEKNLSPSVCRF